MKNSAQNSKKPYGYKKWINNLQGQEKQQLAANYFGLELEQLNDWDKYEMNVDWQNAIVFDKARWGAYMVAAYLNK